MKEMNSLAQKKKRRVKRAISPLKKEEYLITSSQYKLKAFQKMKKSKKKARKK